MLYPTPEANLGVFAAANVAMLLLTPYFGRREVVERMTFGLLGQPHSRSWIFMGPLLAALQLLVNSVNALIIRSISGYSRIDIKTLVLLWCTRPRMAWMVIILIPYQVKEVMYFSCAASSLVAELILQFLSSYTFGIVANHARSQGFYKLDHRLDSAPNGTAAKLMYAGALFWLIIVIVCPISVFFSIFNLETLKGSLSNLASSSKTHEGKQLKRAKKLQQSTKQQHHRLTTLEMVDNNNVDRLPDLLEARSRLMESCDSMVQSLTDMADWVKVEEQDYRKQRSHLRKLESRNDTSPEVTAEKRTAVEELRAQLEMTSKNNADRAMSAKEAAEKQPKATETEMQAYNQVDLEDNKRIVLELKAINRSWLLLERHWGETYLSWDSRNERLRNLEKREREKMQLAIFLALLGVFGCWLSQWIYWAGFVHLYSNQE